jgi:hypothetical protein
MSYVSRKRVLSEYPLKQVTRGSGLPWEIAKALAPIAMNMATPIASAVGERIGRVISPSRKGSGYKLAGMGRRRTSRSRSRSVSSRRSHSGGRRRRSSHSRSRRRSSRSSSRRRSSRSRSRSSSRSRSRRSYKKR